MSEYLPQNQANSFPHFIVIVQTTEEEKQAKFEKAMMNEISEDGTEDMWQNAQQGAVSNYTQNP